MAIAMFLIRRGRLAIILPSALLGLLTGCPSTIPETAQLAERETVQLSAESSAEVPLGAGAASLANTVWALHRVDDDSFLFRVRLGPEGEIVQIFDNLVFAQPWLGSEVIPDGRPHPTAFAGGSYVSGAYVAEQGENIGILGVLHGLLFGQHLGTATLSFYGARVSDRITGTMTRTVEVFAETPFPPPGDAQFAAYATLEQ